MTHTVFADSKNGMREILSLDKGWRFYQGDILFPEVKGHEASYRNAKAGQANGAASQNYDDSSWRILDLPHDWAIEGYVDSNANLSQGYYKRGVGWYRRKFRIDSSEKGKHFELQFDGISTYATIWVNGTLLHRNWCGYTSMYIDITPYITYGDKLNTIAVRVDANSQEGWWYEGAGIYRHSWLVKRSPLHVKTDGIYIKTSKCSEKKWDAPVNVSLYNSDEKTIKSTIEVSLYSPDGKIITSNKRNIEVNPLRNVTLDVPLSVKSPLLWSPETPYLYKVKTVLKYDNVIKDVVWTRCGFRTISFDSNTGFWLNGNNIKIKGVCCHQDHAGVGVAVPDALWEFRLKKLKDMGVNAYRASHNPMSKEFMEACDSLGIMVMDENRVFNTSPEHIRQLQWLIRRDRNCPSVIMWSIFNEEPMQGTENGYEMVRRMCDVVKQMDSSRPVTAAMNGGFFSEYNVSKAVDVAGFNYQINNYDRFHEMNPDLPLISSEDGSAFMVRGEYKTDFSKNIIDSYDSLSAGWGATHRRAWKEISERPWMAGCFYWTGFDYHGEPTPFKWPSVSSLFGIMDLCGFPKMAYYLHQAQWRDDMHVLKLIPHWNWPTDSIGKNIKVMALSNADKVRLLLNDRLISEQNVDHYEMNTWNIPYEPGKLEAVGFKDGKIVSRTIVETTGEAKSIRLVPFRSSIKGNGCDAIPITVEVLDSEGRHVPTANNMIRFSVTGPADIIGLGNGNPNCHEPEKGNKRSLFNGLAQIIIKSTDSVKGEISVLAESEGLKSDTLIIPVTSSEKIPSVDIVSTPLRLGDWTLSEKFIDNPNVNQFISDNDMNSWQPCPEGLDLNMDNYNYVILRTKFSPYDKHINEGYKMIFKSVLGKVEVWLNGKCIGTKNYEKEDDFIIEASNLYRNCDLRLLFQKGAGNRVRLGDVLILDK